MRVRTLIVDDNPTFIESVSSFLKRRPTIELLGDASSGSQALERARAEHPDLVLVDLVMPSMNGLDLTKALRALPQPPRVVVLTLAEHPAYLEHARAAGAEGLLSKYEITSRLMPLIAQLFGEQDGPDEASA